MKILIPEPIQEIVKDTRFELDTIGRSNNTILLYPEMVLKIEKKNTVSDTAALVMKQGQGILPVPEVLERVIVGDLSYTLSTRIHGKMSCDPYYLERPKVLIPLLAEALHLLWSADISAFQGLPTDVDPGYKGPLVFSHGDFCMPNILLDGNKIAGFIDLGDAALSSKWRDLSLIQWSLTKNSDGTFGSRVYEGVHPEDLFAEAGIAYSKEEMDYWISQVSWMSEV